MQSERFLIIVGVIFLFAHWQTHFRRARAPLVSRKVLGDSHHQINTEIPTSVRFIAVTFDPSRPDLFWPVYPPPTPAYRDAQLWSLLC